MLYIFQCLIICSVWVTSTLSSGAKSCEDSMVDNLWRMMTKSNSDVMTWEEFSLFWGSLDEDEDFIITLEEFTDIWGSITGQTNADSLNLFIAMAKRSEADEIDLEDDSTLFIDDNDLWQLWLTMVVDDEDEFYTEKYAFVKSMKELYQGLPNNGCHPLFDKLAGILGM